MRAFAVAVVAVFAGCEGGQAPQLQCEHTQFQDSRCCTLQIECDDDSSEFCAPPGAALGCGACNNEPNECTTDNECNDPNMICEPRECACDQQNQCVAACTATSCAVDKGESCNTTTLRCEPKPCLDGMDCPQDFTCNAGRCLRQGCITDTDCDGFCVEAQCYQTAGECRLPSA